MKVKICGITNIEDAICAIESGAWAIGFIFYKKSPRYIDPLEAKKIIEALPENIKKIGVFVNASLEEMLETYKTSGIDTFQLHGDESPETFQLLKNIVSEKIEIIKAFRVAEENDLLPIKNFHDTKTFLIDSKVKNEYGGSGELTDWDLAKQAKEYGKIILAGGLNSENILNAINQVKPFAIDLSSAVEKSPGIKDHKKIKELFNVIKRGNL